MTGVAEGDDVLGSLVLERLVVVVVDLEVSGGPTVLTALLVALEDADAEDPPGIRQEVVRVAHVVEACAEISAAEGIGFLSLQDGRDGPGAARRELALLV